MMMVEKDSHSELERKKSLIDTLYHHSDLSVESISYQADMSIKQVQSIVDKIRKKEALEVLVEHIKSPIEKIMTKIVVSLESGKTLYDASVLMAKKKVGCLVVTAKSKPFGIVTKGDVVKAVSEGISFKGTKLEEFASRPLVYASSSQTIEEVADLMIKNKIRKLPVIQQGKIVGIMCSNNINGNVGEQHVFLESTPLATDCVWWWSGT